ncbi:MAG: hypothetical protein J7502_06270 [Flavisolibacter sp.]|nr:hypothetical protein [Flavisolibacter sp.]
MRKVKRARGWWLGVWSLGFALGYKFVRGLKFEVMAAGYYTIILSMWTDKGCED